jgi:hypothetical protein
MIRLKGIKRSENIVSCDGFVEDCTIPVPITVNLDNGSFTEGKMPNGYEWCSGYGSFAANYIIDHQDELQEEYLVMWY